MAWIAIDAGTSIIKAIVFSDNGRELSVARQQTTVLHPKPDWSEQDMHEVWDAVAGTVRNVAAASSEPIRGIVCTAQGDGCWLVDESGEPTGNAILWNDARAAALVERWQEAGLVEASFRRSGSVTYSGLPNAILSWLHQHQPERVANSRWVLTCNGWLVSRMTGYFLVDPSDAANPFSDLSAGEYSEATLAEYGLSEDLHRLPEVAAEEHAVWPLSDAAAHRMGLPPGLPVFMAPYDIVTTAYGSGATSAGQACVILGTTICAEVIRTSIDCTGKPTGTTLPIQGGLFLRAMPTLTGCEALQWAADILGTEGIPGLEELAARASVRDTPFFLPYLSPGGERSPFFAPEATGSFHGLTFATPRSAIARAVYEGLSFVVRECLEAASNNAALTEVRVCGGGTRSDLWCQMIADVLGAPVLRPADSENGARGAHVFALFATGEIASIAEGARQHVLPGRTFLSSEEMTRHYERSFRRFKRLRDAMMQQWAEGENQR